ncbi:hypothetical protein E4T56_gene17036 [Termitomyces sp. T112]|nr:hypothetical protein E4T56_gene17036 [Termitomyces sp. T112]
MSQLLSAREDKLTYGDGETICGHLRSLKDIEKLDLAPNFRAPAPDGSERRQLKCPLALREMNDRRPNLR